MPRRPPPRASTPPRSSPTSTTWRSARQIRLMEHLFHTSVYRLEILRVFMHNFPSQCVFLWNDNAGLSPLLLHPTTISLPPCILKMMNRRIFRDCLPKPNSFKMRANLRPGRNVLCTTPMRTIKVVDVSEWPGLKPGEAQYQDVFSAAFTIRTRAKISREWKKKPFAATSFQNPVQQCHLGPHLSSDIVSYDVTGPVTGLVCTHSALSPALAKNVCHCRTEVEFAIDFGIQKPKAL